MEWNEWKGKYIFLKLKDGGVYSGDVIDVDTGQVTFLTIIDKFGQKVTFSTAEIVKIKEEGK
jgi:hypothetical protein|tara:strand:+ start:903 stop:1088 length:186 start_codon:yes stop_codon:yes gene_type:complete